MDPKKIYGENLEMLEGMKTKIIDPRDTRKILGECLNIISDGDQRELKPNTFGVARM